jgi:putative ABC transport system permease protein
LVGSIIGRFTVAKALMKVKQTTLTLPEWEVSVSAVSYCIIGAIALICTLSAILAANKGLRGMPAQTMRGEIGKGSGKVLHVSPNSADTTKKSSFEWRWVLRDISRNKIRYIVGVIGVVGSVMLMMAGLGIKNSIAHSNSYVYDIQYSYGYKAVMSSISEDIYRDIEKKAGIHQWLEEAAVDLEYGKEKRTGVFTVVGKGDYILFETEPGEKINLPNEGIVITHKMASLLQVDKGDKIRFHVGGTSDYLEEIIAEIIMTPTPQGIFLSKEAWESLNGQFNPTAVLLGRDSYAAVSQTDYFKEITPIARQSENMDTMAKSVNSIIMLLIAASLLLSVIILYNLGMLNFVERCREYATMKVIGFYQREIRSIILRDLFVTLIPGLIIGIPVGYEFLKIYIEMVSFTSYEWIAYLEPAGLALIIVVVSGCSLFVNLFIGHKVKKIDMVEVLKSVD